MKKILSIILVAMLCCVVVNASAQCSVTVTITSACDGEPVAGVAVVVKGSTNGTVTDSDGKATLNVPCSGIVILVVYFIGYVPQEFDVTGKTSLDIVLPCDDEEIEE
jgi:hypothetical protein